MTADECIEKKDWGRLALIMAEEIKQKYREELKKKDDDFFSYAVAKCKLRKKIKNGG